MDKPEELDLAQIASSISDGVAIDWGRLRQSGDDNQATAVLREMAMLDKIASFHRSHDVPDTPNNVRRAAETHTVDQPAWGHFRLVERIGEGTFGVVYRAWDSKLESEVALKLLNAPSRMLKEARNLARVRHPNVVTVHGTDLIDNRVGIWMEFVKGSTLANLLKAYGPFGAREAAGVGVDLCRALAAVHAAGLMHGDIKAHNVMRGAGGRTVLMDFGTGKELSDASDPNGPGTNDFAGTPLYVAPEVFDGQSRTKRSEIYSLGVLLYHLVTNEYPVEGRSRAELEQAHKRGERKRLRDARPDLPEPFVHAVERAIAVDPKERYASAGAFEEALARFISGGDHRPMPRPKMVQAIAAVLAAAIGVAGAAYWFGPEWVTREATSAQTTPTLKQSSPAAVTPAAPTESDYQIDAALFRVRANAEHRLRPGDRVARGDGLFVKLRVSVPAYVYIVNEDDHGESYLEFPLPGQSLMNPLPAGKTNRIPGDVNWEVSSAGGREHFIIFASPERQPAFEQMFAALPHPEFGRTAQPMPLPDEAVRRLRGVGGLTAKQPQGSAAKLSPIFSMPLGDTEETTRGLWVRQLTLENPK